MGSPVAVLRDVVGEENLPFVRRTPFRQVLAGLYPLREPDRAVDRKSRREAVVGGELHRMSRTAEYRRSCGLAGTSAKRNDRPRDGNKRECDSAARGSGRDRRSGRCDGPVLRRGYPLLAAPASRDHDDRNGERHEAYGWKHAPGLWGSLTLRVAPLFRSMPTRVARSRPRSPRTSTTASSSASKRRSRKTNGGRISSRRAPRGFRAGSAVDTFTGQRDAAREAAAIELIGAEHHAIPTRAAPACARPSPRTGSTTSSRSTTGVRRIDDYAGHQAALAAAGLDSG
jgi:hypothetical protein